MKGCNNQPFLDWLAQSSAAYTIESKPVIGSMPFRHWWDVDWRKVHHHDVFKADARSGASPGNVWWKGDSGRKAANAVHRCMSALRAVASNSGAYVSESNFFESDFQHSYWGNNYSRLAETKRRYDPDGLFFVHNGIDSERWTRDGFTKL
jgi:hypothetical protein